VVLADGKGNHHNPANHPSLIRSKLGGANSLDKPGGVNNLDNLSNPGGVNSPDNLILNRQPGVNSLSNPGGVNSLDNLSNPGGANNQLNPILNRQPGARLLNLIPGVNNLSNPGGANNLSSHLLSPPGDRLPRATLPTPGDNNPSIRTHLVQPPNKPNKPSRVGNKITSGVDSKTPQSLVAQNLTKPCYAPQEHQ
jgi:hypothetical protein